MGRPYTCPWCGAPSSIKKGFRKTKTMGKRRIRLCKACGRKFTPHYQQGVSDEGTPADLPLTTEDATPEASEPTSDTNEDNGKTTESVPQDP